MKKKLLAFGMAAVMLVSQAMAIDLYVDGRRLVPEVPPVVNNNRIMVPLKTVFDALQANVEWNGESKTITATKDETTLSIQLGSNTAYINGKATYLDTPAQSVNGRTIVPVRFIAEAMNGKVTWEADTQTVYIATMDNYDGYRLAPASIFTAPLSTDDLKGVFMFVDGTVSEYKSVLGYTSCFITTENGVIEITGMEARNSSPLPSVGDKVRMCFRYTGPSTLTNAPTGTFFELGDLAVSTKVQYETPAPAVAAPTPPANTPKPSVTTTEPASSPKNPTQATASPSTGHKIYVTKSGKRYHYDPNCNGGTYYESTLANAKRRGLTPCNKCVY